MAPDLPELAFDPEIDLSPHDLFRRFREGRPPALYELGDGGEDEDGEGAALLTLRGARRLPEDPGDWAPPEEGAVLFDRDGIGARRLVTTLREAGRARGARALYGGLRLYDFALDPRVVGPERYLVSRPVSGAESGRGSTGPGPRRPPRRGGR